MGLGIKIGFDDKSDDSKSERLIDVGKTIGPVDGSDVNEVEEIDEFSSQDLDSRRSESRLRLSLDRLLDFDFFDLRLRFPFFREFFFLSATGSTTILADCFEEINWLSCFEVANE
uniref:Uncharacterized protein n=1 Tax=Tetranychus urticae TaxID=32264 RepID=T1KCG8_TETUR